jgi:hypothetical protein
MAAKTTFYLPAAQDAERICQENLGIALLPATLNAYLTGRGSQREHLHQLDVDVKVYGEVGRLRLVKVSRDQASLFIVTHLGSDRMMLIAIGDVVAKETMFAELHQMAA